MDIRDEKSAHEWLTAWGPRAFTLNRAQRLAADMRTCAGLCPKHSPDMRAGYITAADLLDRAVAEHEAQS